MKYIALLAINVYFFLVFNSGICKLYEYWIDVQGSILYGVFIFILAIYLYCERLGKVSFRENNQITVLVSILLISFFYAVSVYCGIELFQFLAFWIALILLQFALFNYKSAVYISPAILFLIFCFPVFEYLNPLLIRLSNDAVSLLLSFTNLSVNVDGNIIYLPYGNLEITDGCSGVRYLVTSLALAFFMVLTSKINIKKTALLIILAIGLGLLFNWIRIFILVLIAYDSKMQSELVYDHETFGWLLYSVVIVILAYIYIKLDSLEKIKISSFNSNKKIYWLNFVVLSLVISLGVNVINIIPQNYNKPEIKNISNWALDSSPSHNESKDRFKLKYIYSDIATSNVMSSSHVNWRSKEGEDLVPYISDLESDQKWQKYMRKNILINSSTVQYILQKNKITNEDRIKIIFFEIDNKIINSYQKAKLLQIPAFFRQNNYFAYHQLIINCKYNGCDKEEGKVLNAAQNLLKELTVY